jgi:hypothetical protein
MTLAKYFQMYFPTVQVKPLLISKVSEHAGPASCLD